jgi:16S rRNA (cytidine1402-2'-O)-methyltransferase
VQQDSRRRRARGRTEKGTKEATAPRPPDGTLYLVSTPIGNLEDVTHRALRVLREAGVVACEDTRVTRVLLDHYGIRARTVAYHERNRERAAPGLLERLAAGESVALVTDAGTPGVSDPAAHLVALAVERGIPVVPVPGASALLAALVASGLPTARFAFEGFLPRSGRSRRERLARIGVEPRTIVLFEAAPRVAETLRDLASRLGPRRAVVAREITKRFEEFARATLPELAARAQEAPPRGEVVLVVEGLGESEALAERPGQGADAAGADPIGLVERLIRGGSRPSEAVAEVARATGLARRELYRRYLDARAEADGGQGDRDEGAGDSD